MAKPLRERMIARGDFIVEEKGTFEKKGAPTLPVRCTCLPIVANFQLSEVPHDDVFEAEHWPSDFP